MRKQGSPGGGLDGAGGSRGCHEPVGRQHGPCWIRLQAGASPHARPVQLVRRRLQLHLALDRHLHAVLPGTHHRRRRLHLELADRRARAIHRGAELRRSLEPLPHRRIGLPVDEVPRRPPVRLVHRMDLHLRRHPDRDGGGRHPAADAPAGLQQHGLEPRRPEVSTTRSGWRRSPLWSSRSSTSTA